jgi:hypothetical protein
MKRLHLNGLSFGAFMMAARGTSKKPVDLRQINATLLRQL